MIYEDGCSDTIYEECPDCAGTCEGCLTCFDEGLVPHTCRRSCVSCGRPTSEGLRWCSKGCMDEVAA